MPRGIPSPETIRKQLVTKIARRVFLDLLEALPTGLAGKLGTWEDLNPDIQEAMKTHIYKGLDQASEVAAEAAYEVQKVRDAEIVMESIDRVPDNTVMALVVRDIAEEVLTA